MGQLELILTNFYTASGSSIAEDRMSANEVEELSDL